MATIFIQLIDVKMKKIYLLSYLLFVFSLSLYAINRPSYNWDMIPYIAVALSLEYTDDQLIHSKTYEYIKQSVPDPVYTELTHGDYLDYRAQVAQNYLYFTQQLPYYKIRPLYTSLIYLGYKMGINIVTATLLVSILSGVLIAILALLWLLDHLEGFYPYLFAFLITSLGVTEIARVQTPDALSAAILLAAMYFLCKEQQTYFSSLLLILSIFARTDNLILVILLFTYLKFLAPAYYRINFINYIVFTSLAIVSYLSINHLAGHYGWAKVLYHTLVHLLLNPAESEVNIGIINYLQLLFQRGTDEFFLANYTYVFLLAGTITLSLTRFATEATRIYAHLTILIILAILIHFILFPVLWHRFFVAHYIILMTSMIITIFNITRTHQLVPIQVGCVPRTIGTAALCLS